MQPLEKINTKGAQFVRILVSEKNLNVANTEVIIFRRKKQQLDFDLNLKIHGKRLRASSYVLGIYFDEYLHWSPRINHLSHKLVKINALLCKLCHCANEVTIKSIYYAIFHSHLSFLHCMGSESEPQTYINLLQKKGI